MRHDKGNPEPRRPRAGSLSSGTVRVRTGPALRIFLWSRAAIWAIAAITAIAFDDAPQSRARRRWDSPRLHELGAAIDVWARWDSDWFLRIAEHGYSLAVEHARVLPALSRDRRGARPHPGGTTTSWLESPIALAACARLVRAPPARSRSTLLGEAGARRAVLYLAMFPTSLYLGAVYSESLFLALALATFVLAERGQLGLAGRRGRTCAADSGPGRRPAPRPGAVRASRAVGGVATPRCSSRSRSSRRTRSRCWLSIERPLRVPRRPEDRLGSRAQPARARSAASSTRSVRASSSSSPSRCRCSRSRWSPGGVSARRTAATRSVRS